MAEGKKSETLYYYFQGKGSWFKLYQGDLEYKNWNVKLNFTPESYNSFMKLKEKDGEMEGILNEVKQEEDGYYHVFKRPFHKDFGSGPEPLTPPEVIDKEGQPWDRKVDIGNGSDITVKVECYPYTNRRTRKRGRAIRMIAVMIENLVPFTKKDLTPEKQDAISGLTEQPKQRW